MMMGETGEPYRGKAERDGDERMMKSLRWSGREGRKDGWHQGSGGNNRRSVPA